MLCSFDDTYWGIETWIRWHRIRPRNSLLMIPIEELKLPIYKNIPCRISSFDDTYWGIETKFYESFSRWIEHFWWYLLRNWNYCTVAYAAYKHHPFEITYNYFRKCIWVSPQKSQIKILMLYIYKHRPTHDMKAGVNEIRNSMKMRHSQKNCLKFVQNIEIIAEQKISPESMIPRLILW